MSNATSPAKTDMTGTNDNELPLTLPAKLLVLLRLRRDPDGFPPSGKDISDATRNGPGATISHGQVTSLFNGSSGNPRTSTITAVAGAFDAPAAFLLPGAAWDDLTALQVYAARPEARQLLRLLVDLDAEDTVEVHSTLRQIRRRKGLPQDVPTRPSPPPGVDQPREGRPCRRTLAEMAEKAPQRQEGDSNA
ncbi:hypothetical protein ACIG53_13720 [Streptomyces bauhiniae]|uniref:hypothetical protein n=1 Tax=Streptomyces bauhiniae TaxID=2340725 RepID=UPI0037D8AF84